jgi:hypothetical protein
MGGNGIIPQGVTLARIRHYTGPVALQLALPIPEELLPPGISAGLVLHHRRLGMRDAHMPEEPGAIGSQVGTWPSGAHSVKSHVHHASPETLALVLR